MDPAVARIEELTTSECLGLLASHDVGRLCVVEDDFPVAFPVNYRLVPVGDAGAVIVIRTHPGSALDHPETRVGFEIDGIDHTTDTGWSVIARGTLHTVTDSTPPDRLRNWDPRPWVGDRDTWMYLTPVTISGRRLSATTVTWAFGLRGYL